MSRKRPLVMITTPATAMSLMPPKPGVCAICAKDHPPEYPHDQTSLYYQYWFHTTTSATPGGARWPTWTDAMAHCTPEMQKSWADELAKRGIQVELPAKQGPPPTGRQFDFDQ